MKRLRNYLLILVVFSTFSICGCAWIKDQKASVTACYNDPVCFDKALASAHDAGEKAGDLASLSGFPWAEKVAKPLAGYTVLLFTLAVLGNKKRKENQS